VEQLRLNWKRLIEEAPADIKRTNAVALLRSAGVRPVRIEGDTVVLAFRYSIHKENVEKSENQQATEKIISHFWGALPHSVVSTSPRITTWWRQPRLP
jgi:DNA polymerase-3 subunit gamma/tau